MDTVKHFNDHPDGPFSWADEFEEAKKGEIIPATSTEEQREIAWSDEPIRAPSARVSLNTVNDLFNLEGLIDGGYLSFIYGTRRGNFGGWDIQKYKYGNYLMLMDSGGVRQAEYEPYKSRRHDRRQQYDYMMKTYEMVKAFRRIVVEDPTIHTATLEGYEADDAIALLFIYGIGTKRVIAQDKDFFMVRKMREAMTDHTGVPQLSRDLKLPKYALAPNNPGSWALSQAIFGDKSDSIPRLLPSRSGYKQMYNRLIKQSPNLLIAFWNCYAEFGDQFLVNLRLVLLPHPSLTLYDNDYQDLPNIFFEDLVSEAYWAKENYPESLLFDLWSSINKRDW